MAAPAAAPRVHRRPARQPLSGSAEDGDDPWATRGWRASPTWRSSPSLTVAPEHQGHGIGRGPARDRLAGATRRRDRGRVVVAPGTPADLTLYTRFGVMPVAGHWHMRQRAEDYLERRAQRDRRRDRAGGARAHARPRGAGVEAPRAGGDRPRARRAARVLRPRPHLPRDDRRRAGQATALCWVSPRRRHRPGRRERARGPRAGRAGRARPRGQVRRSPSTSASSARPTRVVAPATPAALGFRVYWPSWVMCSVPLPGLDRYMPTRPPHLLLESRHGRAALPELGACETENAARRPRQEARSPLVVLLVAAWVLFKLVIGRRGRGRVDRRRGARRDRDRAGRWPRCSELPAGGVPRPRLLLRPVGRGDRQDQGQLVLHLVPRRASCCRSSGRSPRCCTASSSDEPRAPVPRVRRRRAGARPGLHALRRDLDSRSAERSVPGSG